MIKQILFIATLFYLLCVSSEVIIAGADDDAFRAAVEEIFATYSSANMKKDTDGWISLWDEKGVKMVPNLPAIIGKSAIGELKRKKNNNPDDLTMEIIVEDSQVAGEFGFAHGTYSSSVKPAGGGDTKSKIGKFLTIFKKQDDGSWKIYRDSVSPNPISK
jgi:ketosteroid isomerase-like protein